MKKYCKVEWMTQEFLKETFTYCDSGHLIWRHDRPIEHFSSTVGYHIYQTQRANTVAGNNDNYDINSDRYKYVAVSMYGRKLSFETHKLVYLYFTGILPKYIGFKDGDKSNTRFSNLFVLDKRPKQRLSDYNKSNLLEAQGKHLGVVSQNNHGKTIQIVEYLNNKDIMVLFPSTGFTRKSQIANFFRGNINQPNTPTCFGVGYLGVKFYEKIPKEYKPHYIKWQQMLKRCYSDVDRFTKYYSDVSVSEEFLNFTNFAEWIDSSKYHGKLEDNVTEKDALNLDEYSRIYSRDTCAILPLELNSFFSKRTAPSDKYHNITLSGKMFKAYGYGGNYLGSFDNVTEAVRQVKSNIIEKAKSLYSKYSGLIDDRVLDILLNFELHYDRFYKKK